MTPPDDVNRQTGSRLALSPPGPVAAIVAFLGVTAGATIATIGAGALAWALASVWCAGGAYCSTRRLGLPAGLFVAFAYPASLALSAALGWSDPLAIRPWTVAIMVHAVPIGLTVTAVYAASTSVARMLGAADIL